MSWAFFFAAFTFAHRAPSLFWLSRFSDMRRVLPRPNQMFHWSSRGQHCTSISLRLSDHGEMIEIAHSVRRPRLN